jgi:hypothetical protein
MFSSLRRSQIIRNIRVTAQVAACLAGILVAQDAGAASKAVNAKAAQSFALVVRQNFAKWDQNGDGVLSAIEVDRVVKSPSVKGQEAAAIAAIHRYFRGDDAPAAMSEPELMPETSVEPTRRDVDDNRPHFASDYAAFCKHLKRAPDTLFTDGNGPALNGISQGKLGDCFFVSTVGVAVKRDADFVRQTMRQRADGSYDVRFPGGPMVHINRLTDAEIALSSSAGDQGLWLNVLEKALSEVFLDLPKTKYYDDDIDLDVISRGGNAGRTITLMTGHASTTVNIRKAKKGKKSAPPPSNREMPALIQKFDELLRRKCGEGALVCAATAKKGTLPPHIACHHVIAILDYDADRQIVHLWNPWGNNFQPKSGPDGMANGYTTRQGEFEMPLRDFLRVFRCVIAESPRKAAQI